MHHFFFFSLSAHRMPEKMGGWEIRNDLTSALINKKKIDFAELRAALEQFQNVFDSLKFS